MLRIHNNLAINMKETKVNANEGEREKKSNRKRKAFENAKALDSPLDSAKNKRLKTQTESTLSILSEKRASASKVVRFLTKNSVSLSEESKYTFSHTTICAQGAFGVVFKDPRYKNREGEICQALKHPNVIEILDAYLSPIPDNTLGGCFLNLVMKFYPNDLDTLIEKSRFKPSVLSPENVKIISRQIFKGLEYLDSLSICHRDLKPANILVDEKTLETRICDFGTAKYLVAGDRNISYICSRHYRAPELIFGCTNYETVTDMWSAGCILVEMVTKMTLFTGSSNTEQLKEIMKLLGSPSDSDVLSMNPTELNPIKFPKKSGIGISKYLSKFSMENEFIDLLEKILVFNPKKRLRAKEALEHPYFRSGNNHK